MKSPDSHTVELGACSHLDDITSLETRESIEASVGLDLHIASATDNGITNHFRRGVNRGIRCRRMRGHTNVPAIRTQACDHVDRACIPIICCNRHRIIVGRADDSLRGGVSSVIFRTVSGDVEGIIAVGCRQSDGREIDNRRLQIAEVQC